MQSVRRLTLFFFRFFGGVQLLPYLYERFGKQDLADSAEELVKEKQLSRLRAMSDASKKTRMSDSDPTIDQHVKELEALEKKTSATYKKKPLRSSTSSSAIPSTRVSPTENHLRSNSLKVRPPDQCYPTVSCHPFTSATSNIRIGSVLMFVRFTG